MSVRPTREKARSAPSHETEREIMALAAGQHGVVTRRQLERKDISRDVIQRYVQIGRLVRVHRGVYRFGPVEAPRSRYMAAVLACGDNAVLSHRSAGVLWGITGAVDTVVDVTVAGRSRGGPGIRVHRNEMRADELARVEGIPVTTVARTLYDLASELDFVERTATEAAPVTYRDVERAFATALNERLTTPEAIAKLLERHHGRGAGVLREMIDSETRPAFTRSEAEERFLDLVRRARLPDPVANVKVERLEVDFLWRSERLIVEIDGRRYHASKRAFDNDGRRDAVLTAAGYNVIRVTWDHLVNEPEALLALLVRALCRRQAQAGR